MWRMFDSTFLLFSQPSSEGFLPQPVTDSSRSPGPGFKLPETLSDIGATMAAWLCFILDRIMRAFNFRETAWKRLIRLVRITSCRNKRIYKVKREYILTCFFAIYLNCLLGKKAILLKGLLWNFVDYLVLITRNGTTSWNICWYSSFYNSLN